MSTNRPNAAVRSLSGIALASLLCLAGCAGDAGDWKSAQDADTQEAYEAFLAKHPDSSFAPQAKERSAQLLEERDWAAATRADTPEAYQKFIGQHPDGKWTQEARIRVENFNVMAAAAPEVAPEPPPAAKRGTAVAASAKQAPADSPAAAPPAGKAATAKAAPATAPATPAAVAAAKPEPRPTPAAARTAVPGTGATAVPAASAAATAGFRVQLGAFSSVDKAEAEWTRARGRFPALQSLEPRITPVQTPDRRLFRLQAGVPDEATAKGLCDTLKGGGQPCLVVPAK